MGRVCLLRGVREKEEAAGGTGWDARKKARSQKSEFLQRASITIAKADSRVLDSMRHDTIVGNLPPHQTSSWSVTSTVHNPGAHSGRR